MFIKNKIGTAFNVPSEEYICDTEDDVANLPKNAPMGSYVLVIETNTVKMKDSKGNWIEI